MYAENKDATQNGLCNDKFSLKKRMLMQHRFSYS